MKLYKTITSNHDFEFTILINHCWLSLNHGVIEFVTAARYDTSDTVKTKNTILVDAILLLQEMKLKQNLAVCHSC